MDDLLLQRVRVFLTRHQLFHPAARLLVAVSGGPDSLCLFHVLTRLQALGGPQIHVAHLDHGFRGEQSAEEARFVAAVAAGYGQPSTIERHDVPAFANEHQLNPQAAARQLRYHFLAEQALILSAHAVLVAHHADDQAETVLFHALRGAGPAGLRGMREAVPWSEWADPELQPSTLAGAALLRPLLTSARSEIEAYCAHHQLDPRHDPSNQGRYYTRSRLRHDLIPALRAYNPQLTAALGRTAQICADDYDFIQAQLDTHWPELAQQETGRVHFSSALWLKLHPALQRYALRRAALLLSPAAELSYAQIEAARQLITLGVGHQMQLSPALLLTIGYEQISLHSATIEPTHSDQPQLPIEQLALPAAGTIALGTGWVCYIQAHPPEQASPWWFALDLATISGPLMLRRRQPGDWFRPAGGRGRRKIQDYFVDHKIPKNLRAAWPLLCSGEHILWLPGLRADQRFLATEQSTQILWIGLQPEASAGTTEYVTIL